MGTNNVRVFIAFDLSASGGAFFTLDDTTKGLLDNSTYKLAGDILTDVTQYVTSVSIDRGKSRELEGYNSGTATVVFNNESRIFDPFYTAGTYYGQLVPRKQITIEINEELIYSGYVRAWDLSYDLSGKSNATVSAVDGFAFLSTDVLEARTNSVQNSGFRIVEILNLPEVAWPSALRDIDGGEQSLIADSISEGTSALTYLQLVEQSEPGALFMSRDGLVTFRDSTYAPIPVAVSGGVRPAGGGTKPPVIRKQSLVFTDAPTFSTDISYNAINVIYGTEQLANFVTITAVGGTPQTVQSDSSIASYGLAGLSIDGLLMDSDAAALQMAYWYANRYAEPVLRIDSIRVILHDKSSQIVNQIAIMELNDVVQVIYTPNGVGDAINEYLVVSGISHSISTDSHEVEIKFSTTTEQVAFLLDNTEFGVLDTNRLGY